MIFWRPNTKTRMQTTTVTLLVITAVLWGNIEAFSDTAADCCLTTKDTRIPIQIVASYFQQTTESGCPIPATVFITKKDKKLCAPPEKNSWITRIITHLDKKKKDPQ
ncbi:C-C motif chemokine 3-like [Cyprinus carpio]|uniref:C-C motif chemokine 3-like n=1 Tax=Cyprinus carpio TaxID=7962 RepID=A0A9Q9V9B7_CYPCA|nr:C-C motif chemokine 3-like [Cyprinus carpio]